VRVYVFVCVCVRVLYVCGWDVAGLIFKSMCMMAHTSSVCMDRKVPKIKISTVTAIIHAHI